MNARRMARYNSAFSAFRCEKTETIRSSDRASLCMDNSIKNCQMNVNSLGARFEAVLCQFLLPNGNPTGTLRQAIHRLTQIC